MTRPPVYICAPYAAAAPEERARNINRAAALARLAVAEGYAPICVHPGIAAIYGEEETPELRAMGLEVDRALVRLVAGHPEGEMWVLCPDGEGAFPRMTAGMRVERDAFEEVDIARVFYGVWASYRDDMRAAGLLDRWEACR